MYTGAMVDDALGAGGAVVSNAGLLLPEEIIAINHEKARVSRSGSRDGGSGGVCRICLAGRQGRQLAR